MTKKPNAETIAAIEELSNGGGEKFETFNDFTISYFDDNSEFKKDLSFQRKLESSQN